MGRWALESTSSEICKMGGGELHSCEQFFNKPAGYERQDFVRDQFVSVQDFSGSLRQLADVCRTDIILSLLERPDVICKIDVGNITNKMREVLYASVDDISKVWQGEQEVSQSKVLKAALVSSVELKLDKIVDVFFELFSDGVFHNYFRRSIVCFVHRIAVPWAVLALAL